MTLKVEVGQLPKLKLSRVVKSLCENDQVFTFMIGI